MPENQTFGITFQTTAETAGSKEIIQQLNGVKAAAKDAGEAGKEMGTGLDQGLGKSANPLKQLLAGMKGARLESKAFGELLEGDFSNSAGIAMAAVKGLNMAMRAGPFGILLGAVIALIPTMMGLFGASKEAGKGVEDAGDKSKEAAPKLDALAQAGENAKKGMADGKSGADELVKSLAAVATKAAEALTALNNLAEEQSKQRKETTSQLELMGDIKPSEKMAIEARDQHDTKAEVLGRKQEAAQAELAAAENAISVIKDQAGQENAEAAAKQQAADDARETAKKESELARAAAAESAKHTDVTSDADMEAANAAAKEADAHKAAAQIATDQIEDLRKAGDAKTAHALGLVKGLPEAEAKSQKAKESLALIEAEKATNDAQFVTKSMEAGKLAAKESLTPTKEEKEAGKRAGETADAAKHFGPAEKRAAAERAEEDDLRGYGKIIGSGAAQIHGSSPEKTSQLQSRAAAVLSQAGDPTSSAAGIGDAMAPMMSLLDGILTHLEKGKQTKNVQGEEAQIKALQANIKSYDQRLKKLEQGKARSDSDAH